MKRGLLPLGLLAVALAVAAAVEMRAGTGAGLSGRQQQQPQPPAARPQQPTELNLTITGASGAPPHYAVPDFLSTADAEAAAAAKTIAAVLWDDLRFEREMDMIPRDTYASIPRAGSPTSVPFARWLELGTDGLVIGSIERTSDRMHVEVLLYQVQTGKVAFSRSYDQTAAPRRPLNVRLFAHTIADDLFEQQRALKGVARTKIAFDSDRDGEHVTGTVQQRIAKEIYLSDYDGANQTRFTHDRNLNISPAWSADGRALAYTSYVTGYQDIFVSLIYQGGLQRPAHGTSQVMNFLPAWSPDGRRIAFVSNRDGNDEIYVMNADGSNVQRLTRNPAIDSSPTWSPSGTQIAFTSDRTGSPQIYVMSADGVGQSEPITRESYCDRPTWSPPPFDEIAYTSRTSPNVFDIRIVDVATRKVRQITSGEAHNESPAYAPNGRHLAFMSNRTGRYQIYTIDRVGRDLRQLTTSGSNYMPNWSR